MLFWLSTPPLWEIVCCWLSKIDVGGAEAQLIDLVAGPEVKPPRRLIGVRAIRGDTAWFVKFDGAPEIVAKEMENFKTLIRKLPLPE